MLLQISSWRTSTHRTCSNLSIQTSINQLPYCAPMHPQHHVACLQVGVAHRGPPSPQSDLQHPPYKQCCSAHAHATNLHMQQGIAPAQVAQLPATVCCWIDPALLQATHHALLQACNSPQPRSQVTEILNLCPAACWLYHQQLQPHQQLQSQHKQLCRAPTIKSRHMLLATSHANNAKPRCIDVPAYSQQHATGLS